MLMLVLLEGDLGAGASSAMVMWTFIGSGRRFKVEKKRLLLIWFVIFVGELQRVVDGNNGFR